MSRKIRHFCERRLARCRKIRQNTGRGGVRRTLGRATQQRGRWPEVPLHAVAALEAAGVEAAEPRAIQKVKFFFLE